MRTIVAAMSAALLAAAPALAAQDARQGIDHARAAGIAVDPAAEPLMAEAPVQTCPNDPTLPQCPPAHAVIASDGSPYAPLASATTARTNTLAGLLLDQCRLRVTVQSPYRAAGHAQMDAQNVCSAAVTTHELYGVLRMFKKGAWYAMASRYKGGGLPGKMLTVHVTYKCHRKRLHAWQAHADGYALMQGVWYAASQSRYNNLHCA